MMAINKKIFQNIFKLTFYALFKILYGSIRGVIKKNDKNIEVSHIKKNENISYYVYRINKGILYTDRINDTAIIKDYNIIQGPSFQFRSANSDIINSNIEENVVFKKGTPRFRKKIKGKVLSLLTGGGGNDNYWHWLFDVLPRISICVEIIKLDKIDFFLLPNNKRKFQTETLEILGIKKQKQISSINHRHIICDELYATTHPVCVTNNATNDIQNMPVWISEWLREKFLKKIENDNQYEKIYIDRADSFSNVKELRSIVNEQEVKDFLLKKGFKIVKLGDLHFKEQIKKFNNAKIIVGLHGAGFANLVFCKPGTKIIELRNMTSGKMIEDLAIKNNLEHRSVSCEPTSFDHSNQFGHISVPIENLQKEIELSRINF